MIRECVPGRLLGPITIGMTREQARAALLHQGATRDVRRWPYRRAVLAAQMNSFQVFFDDREVVEEVEAGVPHNDVRLGEVVLLGCPVADVVLQVSRFLAQDPTVSERGTGFEWAAGLRLWKQTREDDGFTTALVFRV